ncbi:hypothetical protein [Streptomyces aureus]
MGGWLGWDWGTVPAWVGTVITSGSASIAAVSYRRSIHDKEREQASKVAAWTSVSYERDEAERTSTRVRRLYVHNSSDAPVYEVTVEPKGAKKVAVPELQAGGLVTFEIPSGTPGRRSYAPSASVKFWVVSAEVGTVTETVKQDPTFLEFRDAVGRWWARSSDGKIKSIRARSVTGTYTRSGQQEWEWLRRKSADGSDPRTPQHSDE